MNLLKKEGGKKSTLFFLASNREEEESLRDKIRADHERALQEAKEKLRMSRQELQAEIQTEKVKVMEELKKREPGPKPLPPVPMPKVVGVSDGEPPEPDVKEKRDKIREVRPPPERSLVDDRWVERTRQLLDCCDWSFARFGQ